MPVQPVSIIAVHRLLQQSYVTTLQACWSEDPSKRPAFEHVIVSIRGLLEGATNKQKLQKTLTGLPSLPHVTASHVLHTYAWPAQASGSVSWDFDTGFSPNPESLASVWHSTGISAVPHALHTAWLLDGSKQGINGKSRYCKTRCHHCKGWYTDRGGATAACSHYIP